MKANQYGSTAEKKKRETMICGDRMKGQKEVTTTSSSLEGNELISRKSKVPLLSSLLPLCPYSLSLLFPLFLTSLFISLFDKKKNKTSPNCCS